MPHLWRISRDSGHSPVRGRRRQRVVW